MILLRDKQNKTKVGVLHHLNLSNNFLRSTFLFILNVPSISFSLFDVPLFVLFKVLFFFFFFFLNVLRSIYPNIKVKFGILFFHYIIQVSIIINGLTFKIKD
jgi:hypothetical protein